MKDDKLTEIMFRSLKRDPALATFDEWKNAGLWALDMRFFPHALNCFQMAHQLHKADEIVLTLINDTLDRITNVLEFIPIKIKAQVEEIRLNNPLDPARWLAIANSILKDLTSSMAVSKVDPELLSSARFALAFSVYCAARSGVEVEPINSVLKELNPTVDLRSYIFPKLDVTNLKTNSAEGLKAVALGDNVTLGLQPNFEIKFQETYHYLWSKALKRPLSLACNAVSGSGVLDLALYLGRDVIYYKPDIALINFGTTDIWLGKDIAIAYEVLLEECVRILRANSIKVVIITPTPHIPSACPPDQRPSGLNDSDLSVKPLAEACRRVAFRTGVVLADAYAKFPEDQYLLKNYLVNGFNQPNLEGQKLIKSALDEVTI
jgi:hypothetical protein